MHILRLKWGVLLLLCLLTISAGKRPPSILPEITSETEPGFHDFVFSAYGYQKSKDGTQSVVARGKHKGRLVSLTVVLHPVWKAGPSIPDLPLVIRQGRVSLRSVGRNSDALLKVMDERYGTHISPRAMRKSTDFTGLTLAGDPRNLQKGMTKIKLFFESEQEDRYAELFLNIDLKARKVYLREKDPEYRKAIIQALRLK